MSYNADKTIKHLHVVVSDYQENLVKLSEKVCVQQEDVRELEIQLKRAKNDRSTSRPALLNVTNKLQTTMKQRANTWKQVSKCQQKMKDSIEDHVYYEEEILSKNTDLLELVNGLKSEISTMSTKSFVSDDSVFFQTKELW
jgi:iron-sulfur cluster repair protein YtfE (RIC family)